MIFVNANVSHEMKKKNLKTNDPAQPQTTSNKWLKHHPGTDMTNSHYPVHGEALLKDDPKKTKTTLPSLTTPNPKKEEDKENGKISVTTL